MPLASQEFQFEEILDHSDGVNALGYFPEMIKSVNSYILAEFKQNRITGPQYAEVLSRGLEYASQQVFTFALAKSAGNNEFALRKQAMLDEQERFTANLAHDLDKQLKDQQHDLVKMNATFVHELEKQTKDQTYDSTKYTKTLAHEISKQSNEFSHNLTKQSADITHDKFKFDKQLLLQEDKLAIERSMNIVQEQLVNAQAKAFKGKHNKDLAKIIMDIVTVGVAQEQMDILAGPNAVFGGISPSTVFSNAAWPVSV